MLKCRVLDIDPVKKIADLSEKLGNSKTLKSSNKEFKSGSETKAIVELNKDNYLITTLKNDRSKICLCVV